MSKNNKSRTMKPQFTFIDGLIGFVLALWISDSFIEPAFAAPHASYGVKLWHWLVVTLLFLVIGLLCMACAMFVRLWLKGLRQK